jgi:hypothetical protein
VTASGGVGAARGDAPTSRSRLNRLMTWVFLVAAAFFDVLAVVQHGQRSYFDATFALLCLLLSNQYRLLGGSR